MRRPIAFWAALVLIFLAGTGLYALDEVSAAMKRILDHRGEDFAVIRKDPHGAADDISYASTLLVPGAKACYIAQTAKPHYSDECDVLETKNRAVLMSKYKQYSKALEGVSPLSWTSWTEHTAKPLGESTYVGPDHSHPAAAVHWALEGMNLDWYDLSVTFYGDGYALADRK